MLEECSTEFEKFFEGKASPLVVVDQDQMKDRGNKQDELDMRIADEGDNSGLL